jgi:hypothetical protein
VPPLRPGGAAVAALLVITTCTAGTGEPPVVTSGPTTTSTVPATTGTVPATTSAPPTTSPPTTPPPALDRSGAATLVRLRSDLEVLLVEGPRPSGSDAERAAAAHFEATIEALGLVASVEEVPIPGGQSRNVWSPWIGSGGPRVLLGAHIDSVPGSPGADDNGSGVVLLLEVMRRLVESPPVGVRVAVVGFGAEEVIAGFDHHYGSRLAASRMAASGDLPDLMASVDMVGLADLLYAVDFEGLDPSFADTIAAAGADAGIAVVRITRGDISDHEAFARAGVPAVMVWRPDNPAWHTPGDDTVTDAALLETLALLEVVISRLADG